MALEIYTYPNNKNTQKALIAAEYVGAKVDVVKDFQMGVTNKTPEFLAMNPIGKVPVLKTSDGSVFESNAIAKYVARIGEGELLGTTPIDMAHVDQWIFFSMNEIDRHVMTWLLPLFGLPGVHYNQTIENNAIQGVKRGLDSLNAYLASKTFLVADMVTVADIILTCDLLLGFTMIWDAPFTAPYPHVTRYFFTMVNQPEFSKILGEVKQTTAPKKKEKETKPKEEKPKKEKQPKQPKPAEAPKPKPVEKGPEDAAEEDEAPAPPKKPNPLDLLPPSPMKIDDWKRLYSNTKAAVFRDVAIKGFWDMLDPEGYSLWFCDYKYNDENTVNFVTMNKVSGFLQRMEFINKYAFAKMCILGDSAPFEIKGVWLFRGQEIPQRVLEECYDIELYEWKKVDLSDEAQKNRVSDMFEETDLIDGKTLLECKCFK